MCFYKGNQVIGFQLYMIMLQIIYFKIIKVKNASYLRLLSNRLQMVSEGELFWS